MPPPPNLKGMVISGGNFFSACLTTFMIKTFYEWSNIYLYFNSQSCSAISRHQSRRVLPSQNNTRDLNNLTEKK